MNFNDEKIALSRLRSTFEFMSLSKKLSLKRLEFQKFSIEEIYVLDGYALAIFPLLYAIMEAVFKKTICFIFGEIKLLAEKKQLRISVCQGLLNLFIEEGHVLRDLLSVRMLYLTQKDYEMCRDLALQKFKLGRNFDKILKYFNDNYRFNLFKEFENIGGRTSFNHLVSTRNKIAHGEILRISYKDEISNIYDIFNFLEVLIQRIEEVQYDYRDNQEL